MESSSATKTPGRNSDIDFNDVFGGPPRRSSIHKTRYSFGDNSDSSFAFRRSDETVAESRNSWSGLREKPVYGEEEMSRRRYSKKNFFDGIFGGIESLSSSPRKYEMKDPFAAGSQLLSQARPLPPNAEPFGSSFPAQCSLAKSNKGLDFPTFGSTTKSKDGSSNGLNYNACSPLSRFSGQANKDKDELSSGREKSTNLSKYDETEATGNSKEDSKSSEASKNGSRFHFSIYKWANKGSVPLAFPLRGSGRLKEKDKLQRCSSANGWITCESRAKEPKEKLHDSFSSIDRMSSNAKSLRAELDKNENGNIPKSESEVISGLKSTGKNISGDTVLNSSEGEEKTHYPLPQLDKETHKPQPKPLNLLSDNDDNEQGNDEMARNSGIKDISEKSDSKNIKKQDEKKKAASNNVEASKTSMKQSPRNSWDNGQSRVRGKVKEFIKIFNRDASSKPRKDNFRWRERDAVKPENDSSISMNEKDEKIHKLSMQKKKSSPDVPVANHMFNAASKKNINSSVKYTVSDGSKTIVEDLADSLEDNFLIKDLTPEERIFSQFGIDPEEIKAIDAKIRQWSNGKKGNIRSLLSTLQYVLWPDSGWKPVPLVDIIEGPAVKRSYQKALLCLHPDKLQQKGAASDKKYMAEKIFDILQDAWTHFNSLSLV